MTDEAFKNGRHDGVRYAIEIYIASNSAELETMVRIGSPVVLPAISKRVSPHELLTSAGASAIANSASDWRFMTNAEIEDYRRRET